MSERDVELALSRAKKTYDASCGGKLIPLRPVLPPAPGTYPPSQPEAEPIDVDAVRRARENLWLRIPKVHRAPQDVLAARVRDAALLAQSRAWAWGSGCLLVSGPTEVGKSSAAALVLLRLMTKGREADYRRWRGIRWYGANELMRHAREWPLGSGECPSLRQAATCELLVIDDLGNEQEWQTTTFDLLQSRYERGLPNIVTTGLRLPQLLERYGDAILRRLAQREGKMGAIIDCWGAQ